MKKEDNISPDFFKIPRWEEIPNIDLYLDQVVNFIDESLANCIIEEVNIKKEETTHKVITKTMINNYVKQGVVEPPIKKKYTKKHIAYLIIISILKQVYSINDIDNLIKLAIKTTSVDLAYNIFCEELEKTINLTFAQKDFSDTSTISKEKYILRNVAQTFASKLYVQKVFLKK